VILTFLKGAAGVLSPLLYIGSAAGRCIRNSDDSPSLREQRGNQIDPTYKMTLSIITTIVATHFKRKKREGEEEDA